MARQQFSDAILVRTVDYGPEKTDANRLNLQMSQAINDFRNSVFIKRCHNAPLCIDPFWHGERISPGNIRLWVRYSKIERLYPSSLADDKNVWVTLRSYEGRSSCVARQDGIDCTGRPVNEHLRPLEEINRLLSIVPGRQRQGIEDATNWIVGSRGGFEKPNLIVILNDKIGERPPGIARQSH
jgi:hypothetical protein